MRRSVYLSCVYGVTWLQGCYFGQEAEEDEFDDEDLASLLPDEDMHVRGSV